MSEHTRPSSGAEAIAREHAAGDPFDRRHREERRAALVAKHGLREDLGDYGEPRFGYDLDDGTRNLLIAHTRQDVAHALALAIFIHRRQRRHGFALWAVVSLLAYIAWAVS